MQTVRNATKDSKQPIPTGPEWVRPGALQQLFGITRPGVYLLAERGEIEISQIKAAGARRGICLVNVASVRAMIERHRTKPVGVIGGAA